MTTTYTLRTASPAKTRTDAVVVGVLSTDQGATLAPGAEDVATAYGRKLRPMLETMGVTGKTGEVVKVPTTGTITAPLLVLVGLGTEVTPVSVRRAAGVAARNIPNASSVALALPATDEALVSATLTGFVLGGYTFTTYKKPGKDTRPSEVGVLSPVARSEAAKAAFESARVVADAVLSARDWVNEPPGDFTPERFAEAATAAHAEATKGRGAPEVTLEVFDEKQLAEMECGGILGVGAASAAPPRLVKLTYAPQGASTHLALVGKGITFDSGGLTIKPAGSMGTMKSDMAGAAAVVQSILAIARLGLQVKVTAWAPLAENMVSGNATRPGDVLTIRGGTTVEVLNTDAEGRLVLADALVLAVEEEPDVVLDVATLTGHMVLALGDKVTGVLGDDETVAAVVAAGERAGEAHWPMPIPEEMDERIRSSKIADLAQHDWVRWGGGLYAAAFLREFVGDVPWAHLDIAGPSFNSGGPFGDWTSGGTGVSVQTLVEYARTLAEG
ncbi:leucyl aminopeptidase [Nocardioides daphniae]|uniref:Probable cytosol aminopeptidase n=1 Tax=Nocardioides daphniae TaxID=402297 RepID=A0ABQ1QMK0_9ACTN|nr:leucyl aminopeptidase [Nocardioides daphniae]GGD31587.1 putative cytosol aminopeptidase [Nocardioides daphniae]